MLSVTEINGRKFNYYVFWFPDRENFEQWKNKESYDGKTFIELKDVSSVSEKFYPSRKDLVTTKAFEGLYIVYENPSLNDEITLEIGGSIYYKETWMVPSWTINPTILYGGASLILIGIVVIVSTAVVSFVLKETPR
jgi:hypothetical protein